MTLCRDAANWDWSAPGKVLARGVRQTIRSGAERRSGSLDPTRPLTTGPPHSPNMLAAVTARASRFSSSRKFTPLRSFQ